jgi:hypothetical protein
MTMVAALVSVMTPTAIRLRPRTLLIALRDPRDGLLFPEAETVLLGFGYSRPTLMALAAALGGEYRPRTDPVDLDGFGSKNQQLTMPAEAMKLRRRVN